MILPLDPARLRERNRLDAQQEIEEAAGTTNSERMQQAIALSDLARGLALGLGNRELLERQDDLEEKARLYVAPLRLLHRK
jgi:hypothetical protein